MAILIITHDLGVIAEVADEVLVMYAGKIVESAPVAALFADPQHPYTIGLLGSIPRIEIDRERLSTIEGTVPSPNNQPKGCRFRAALSLRRSALPCRAAAAAQHRTDHQVACWKAPVELAIGERARATGMSTAATPVLQVDGLVKHFPVSRGLIRRKVIGMVRAVEGVSFEIARGETLALVGESGCGKSTTGRLVLRLMDPTAGSVRFKGEEIAGLGKQALRRLRRHMQIIFQDPYASLNPRMTVGEILAEPMAVHNLHTEAEREKRVKDLLDVVGLLPEHARALSASVLRGPAPEDRHRPCPGGQSRSDHLRRAGIGARRLDPGADRQPAAEPAAALRPLLSLHRPRPRRGEAHQ